MLAATQWAAATRSEAIIVGRREAIQGQALTLFIDKDPSHRPLIIPPRV